MQVGGPAPRRVGCGGVGVLGGAGVHATVVGMRRLAVALLCPDCGAPAELRSVLTDRGFLVARAALAAHLESEHGHAGARAAALVSRLTWKTTPLSAVPLH